MPRLSVWTIRASLIYLALGFTFGALMLWNKGLPLDFLVWALLPAHIEFLILGWTVQLIFGMAFWILPKFSRTPRRGNERAAWLAFILLNLGIGLVSVASLGGASSLAKAMVLAGRAAEVGAALSFTIHAWPRVKAAGV